MNKEIERVAAEYPSVSLSDIEKAVRAWWGTSTV